MARSIPAGNAHMGRVSSPRGAPRIPPLFPELPGTRRGYLERSLGRLATRRALCLISTADVFDRTSPPPAPASAEHE